MEAVLTGLGRTSIDLVRQLGGYARLAGRAVTASFGRWPRRRVLLEQAIRVGNESLPVVLTTGIFTGMVLAVQSYSQFKRVELQSLVGAVVGLSMTRELGPVLTGLMLAGRVGAAMAAELGTMKVTEQIDALEAMATDPVRYLVLPRFLACLLLTPLLTALVDVIGCLGAYFVTVDILGVDRHFYIQNALEWVFPWAIISGLLKAAVFGGIIAVVCCYKGLHAEAGAEGVGKATTQAVVASCILILLSDFMLTVLMY
ncbi:MAG: ABC transporter permease [Planctomycetes bacterium]|nr:ABC transporter permease [Planctomycetota bacterium]